jgi:hypothetical protein
VRIDVRDNRTIRTHAGVMTVLLLAALAAARSLVVEGQSSEFARLIRNGETGILSVFGPRPLDLAAGKLADEFGIGVNVEDPAVYTYADDVQLSHVTPVGKRVFIPKFRFLELRIDVAPDGSLAHLPDTLSDLVETANVQMPFRYRVDITGTDTFTLVPTAARDDAGNSVERMPLMEYRVTVPLGTRKVYEHISLMMQALEAQTGIRVTCCQPGVGGVPWGSNVVAFEARGEVVRTAFLRLVRSVPSLPPRTQGRLVERETGRYYWLMRCQPREPWCAINVRAIPDQT